MMSIATVAITNAVLVTPLRRGIAVNIISLEVLFKPKKLHLMPHLREEGGRFGEQLLQVKSRVGFIAPPS
jgi:hypothetical protein